VPRRPPGRPVKRCGRSLPVMLKARRKLSDVDTGMSIVSLVICT
jgi:hypothetical protein